MYSFSQDSKYLFIDNNALDEHWKLEKNQISFKWVNELVMIDRNGMHYKNIAYTDIVGGFANAQDVVTYLESLVADASINVNGTITVDTTGLATSANQTNGNQLTQITDGAGTVNTKQLGTAVTSSDVGLITNTVIHGRSTAGGGSFVDVKVNPSGTLPVEATIQGSVPVTDNGGSLTVDGSVSVSNFPATQNVSVTNTPNVNTGLTQPLTDAQLRATPVPVSGTLTVDTTGLATSTNQTSGDQVTQIVATEEDGSYPDPSSATTGQDVKPNIDTYGNLRTRGEALTDELSFRDDFSGNTLSTDWAEELVGGASVTVANSDVVLSSSTASGDLAKITYALDYLPLTLRATLDISQRIANQIIRLGFIYRDTGVITQSAYIQFTGTNSQKVNCISQSSADASDVQTSANITLPSTFDTSQNLYYKIDVSNNAVTFQVSNNGLNYTPLAQHTLHLPTPYQPLDVEISIENTAIVTNTNVNVDLIFANNMNRLQVDQDFTGEPLPSQLIGAVGNTYKNVNATPTGDLKVELSGNNTSAFGDINVAELTPVLQLDFVYGILTALGTGSVVSGGTTDTNGGRLRHQTGTNTAGASIFQSTKVAKYRPGQGIDAKFTRVFQTGVANSQQECGMGDTINGYFFGYVGTTFGIIYRNASSQTFIPQSSWNIDPCDGTGLSAFNINPTFGNVYRIKYPYLGYGDIKFFIQDPNVGQFILVHVIKYANTSAAVQLSNPNLTFWSRNINSGNNTNLIGYVGSVGVFLSGQRKYLGQTGYAYNNKSLTSGGGITNLFTIKNATTFNTVPNKSLIRLTSNVLSVGNLGNNQFGYLFLIKNATLGGTPSYTPDNGSTADNGATITSGQSPASVDVAGTTVTGGTRVWASNGVNTSNSFIDVTEFDIFIAPGETLTFAGLVTANSGLSAVSNYILDI